MLRIEKLSKSYNNGGSFAVNQLSLNVTRGEFIALLGESGCGKTTTLKMINRLIEPSSGRIIYNGSDVSGLNPVSWRRQIGYVFQGIGLFPHFDVKANIGAIPKLLGWQQCLIDERVDQLLNLMEMAPKQYRNRNISELSGGEQQRIGVARALAANPQLLLMDEPFGALDPMTRAILQEQFKKLQVTLGLTVVMVTHDVNEALLLADRIIIMQAGKIVTLGSPRQLLEDKNHPYATALLETPLRQTEKLAAIIHSRQNK